ncbi:MAG: TIGR03905 family TSCPD domain-containing protein [Bacteroidales bacterium]|nr:TIGR03905 family TSCPD domain-containing protein [Bacteroidales bacterium]
MNDVILTKDIVTPDGVRVIRAQTSWAVCSQQIDIAIKDDTIYDVAFVGGCMGNTCGVARLCKGMKVQDVIERLEGIDCGGKGTSCPDQLARALKQTLVANEE